MVKVDYSQDYYGDLELSSSSGLAEIKKQYKKLALMYHPDRNVGSSNSDPAKFQRIQTAYEILNDPSERAKYDSNRKISIFTNVSSSRTRTGTQGNPWSHVGKEYPPPPPRPPTARNRYPHPTSNGARRYEKFTTPQKSAYQASQEGPQARKDTYNAWEYMRGSHGSEKSKPNNGKNRSPPDLPPRDTQTNRKEKKPMSPTRSKTSDNSNDVDSKSSSQNSSSISSNRKSGFMPSSPGGDELPAPKGHYFTHRAKPEPPPVPRRNHESSILYESGIFSDKSGKIDLNSPFQRRMSTPYASQGGERFNPLESSPININRSKSTIEKGENFTASKDLFTAESDKERKAHKSPRARASSRGPKLRSRPVSMSFTISSDSEDIIENFDKLSTSKHGSEASSDQKKYHIPVAKTTSEPTCEPLKTRSKSDGKSYPESSPAASPDYIPPRPAGSENIFSSESKIFSFNLEDDTFNTTEPRSRKSRLSSNTENISTKFSAEDWDGKFSAGSDSNFFSPDACSDLKSPRYAQSVNHTRTRSPTKSQLSSLKRSTKLGFSSENSNKKKFSAEEWAETFKPNTFMPPPHPPVIKGLGNCPVSSHGISGPNSRLSTDSSLSSVRVNSNEDGKLPLPSRESEILNTDLGNTQIPEPMDIDLPQTSPADTVPKNFNANSHATINFQKRRSSHSKENLLVNEARESQLNVNFSDLKIKDIILEFPLPPNPPMLPQEKSPSPSSYGDYEARFQKYMSEWDHFDKKFLLHLVARKNNNEVLGEKRWKGAEADFYRTSIKEDQAVLKKWTEAKKIHENVVTDWIVLKDIMSIVGQDERPRKKTF